MKLPDLLIALGRAGAEIATDPDDPTRLRFRPRGLDPDLLAGIRQHKPALLALLRGESVYGLGNPCSKDDYLLFAGVSRAPKPKPAEVGSHAWLVEVGRALAEREKVMQRHIVYIEPGGMDRWVRRYVGAYPPADDEGATG